MTSGSRQVNQQLQYVFRSSVDFENCLSDYHFERLELLHLCRDRESKYKCSVYEQFFGL